MVIGYTCIMVERGFQARAREREEGMMEWEWREYGKVLLVSEDEEKIRKAFDRICLLERAFRSALCAAAGLNVIIP
jgi:hypothetical protein